jgi:hypothetical protein
MQQSELIYMDIGPSIGERKQTWVKPDDDRVEYATLNHQPVPAENQPVNDTSTVGEPQVKTIIIFFNMHCRFYLDKQLNLDNLLIQLRTQVTPSWYQFGLTLGVDKDVLNKFSECPQEHAEPGRSSRLLAEK